jgi:hypothetical protein
MKSKILITQMRWIHKFRIGEGKYFLMRIRFTCEASFHINDHHFNHHRCWICEHAIRTSVSSFGRRTHLSAEESAIDVICVTKCTLPQWQSLFRTWDKIEYRLEICRAKSGVHIETYWGCHKTPGVSPDIEKKKLFLSYFMGYWVLNLMSYFSMTRSNNELNSWIQSCSSEATSNSRSVNQKIPSVMQFDCCYSYRIHKSPSLTFILSHVTPVHIHVPYFCAVHFNKSSNLCLCLPKLYLFMHSQPYRLWQMSRLNHNLDLIIKGKAIPVTGWEGP